MGVSLGFTAYERNRVQEPLARADIAALSAVRAEALALLLGVLLAVVKLAFSGICGEAEFAFLVSETHQSNRF